MKRPNAIIYMSLWGGVAGWLTAAGMLFTLNILVLGGNDFMTASALFGGISGMFLGFISGILLHWMLDNIQKQGYEAFRAEAENLVSSFSFLGMLVMLFGFRIPLGISVLYVCLIPISLWLGTGRYFAKIKPIFPMIQAGVKAKKLKNSERIPQALEDKQKQEALSDNDKQKLHKSKK